MSGYHVQIPGTLSRRGVIDVGLFCVHSCQFCFYKKSTDPKGPFDFMRHAEWRPTEQLVKQARLMGENGFIATDITGGEPTLHPGIVDVVRTAVESGVAPRIITLGQFLDKKKGGETLLDRLLGAGIVDFRFSRHSTDPEIFKKITGGDLEKQTWALRQLDDRGFEYTTNSTVMEDNYRTMPDVARELATHNIYYVTLIFFMPHYEHSLSVDKKVRMRYSDAAQYVKEAVDILEDAGIAVGVRYAPQCIIAGIEKNHVGMVGVRHDPHEWMNCVEHSGPGDAERESQWMPMKPNEPPPGTWLIGASVGGPFFGRGTAEGVTKVFTQKCQTCTAIAVCDGIDKGYLDEHGDSELVPYMYDHRGSVLDKDRLNYIAGHVAKLTQDGKPSKAIKRLLRPSPLPPEPLVSVVIPNYNHAGEITRCLDSLANQTYRKLEIIVVDDHSTDDSLEVTEKWLSSSPSAHLVDVIFRKENSGLPAIVKNQGMRASSGDILFYLDPDDWVEPTYVEECVRKLKGHPEASIVYSGVQTFGMETVQWVAIPFDAAQEINGNYIGCFSLFRREVFEDVGGYDEDPAINGCEDWGMWVSAVRLGHYAIALPRQLVHYCRSESGLFETVVKPHLAEKQALVRQKNQEVYPHQATEEAEPDMFD